MTDHDQDRRDYMAFLSEHGFTEEQMQSVVQDRTFDHRAPLPEWFRSVRIGPSNIHGLGLFAITMLAAGEVIAPARIDGLRAPLAGTPITPSPRTAYLSGARMATWTWWQRIQLRLATN